MSKMSDYHVAMQEMGSIVICPACETNFYTPYEENFSASIRIGIMPPRPALSRRDNKTYICSQCGLNEAMEDFVNRG